MLLRYLLTVTTERVRQIVPQLSQEQIEIGFTAEELPMQECAKAFN